MTTKIRQKPPPKPPRMKPSMVDQNDVSADAVPSHREGSPGIISLRSSTVDVAHDLDSSLQYGGELLMPSPVPAVALTLKDHLENIMVQTHKFFVLQVDMNALVRDLHLRTLGSKLDSRALGNEEAKWDRLVSLVLSDVKSGLLTLSEVLRDGGIHQLADLMLVLNQLLKIGLAKDSAENGSDALCSVCKYNQANKSSDESISSCPKFDVEIICIDSETDQVISLKNVPVGKRASRNISLSSEEKLLIKDYADRYVPALSVSIVNQCLCHQGQQQLAQLLKHYSCIYELAIVKNHLNIETIEQLFGEAGKVTGLTKLDLRLNSLDDECAEALFGYLAGSTSLQVVNIASTGLTATGLTHLLSALGKSKTLSELDIGFNSIHNSGARIMSKILSSNIALSRLRMKSNYLTADGAKWIFQALKKNSRLGCLDVSGNLIEDAGCQFVSESLLCNRTLRELNLEGCHIGKPGCQYLARAMKTNTTLKVLDLSRNPLKDEGVEALSEGIKYNQVLDILCLNMCEIANCGFSKLMDALQYNMTMTTLKLCYNLIGYPVTVKIEQSEEGEAEQQQEQEDESKTVPTVQDIYERVCQILQTNKDLKVLLWGNRLNCDEESGAIDNGISQDSTDSASEVLSDDLSVCEPLCDLTLSKQVSREVRQAIFETPFGSPLGKRVFSDSASTPSYSERNNNHSK